MSSALPRHPRSIHPGRRAAIQVQFTWIFALIAGAVILLFFFKLIGSVTETSEDTLCSEVARDLDAIFVGAGTSIGTTNNLSLPGLDMTFDCTGYSLPECSSPYGGTIVFSPARLEGSAVVSHAAGLDIPYRVAPLLYLSSPDYRYIFIGDAAAVRGLAAAMPKPLLTETLGLSAAQSLTDMNSPAVRVVVSQGPAAFTLDLGELNSLSEEVVSVVGIQQTNADLPVTVTFFRRDESSPTPYTYVLEKSFQMASQSLVLGAVLSGDATLFECTLAKALERSLYVTEEVLSRTMELKQSNKLSPSCQALSQYKNAVIELTTIHNELSAYIESGSPGTLSARGKTLSGYNDALRLYSCPTLY